MRQFFFLPPQGKHSLGHLVKHFARSVSVNDVEIKQKAWLTGEKVHQLPLKLSFSSYIFCVRADPCVFCSYMLVYFFYRTKLGHGLLSGKYSAPNKEVWISFYIDLLQWLPIVGCYLFYAGVFSMPIMIICWFHLEKTAFLLHQ